MFWILIVLVSGFGIHSNSSAQLQENAREELTGSWKMKVTGGNISRPQNFDNITLEIEQQDSILTGTYMNPDLSEKGEIEGTVKGSKVVFTRTFRVSSEENTYKAKYTGSVENNNLMSGELLIYLMNGEQIGVPMHWTAKRK